MTEQLADLTIQKTITVDAAQEVAFEVFTERIGSWWPLESRSIGSAKPETAVMEPHAGGRWYERGIDGSECEWGRVIAFEPPSHLVLNWQISAQWSYDPTINTELEVRFVPEGASQTRVELEHRGLVEAYGDQAAQIHAIFDSSEGWAAILDQYKRLVAR